MQGCMDAKRGIALFLQCVQVCPCLSIVTGLACQKCRIDVCKPARAADSGLALPQ